MYVIGHRGAPYEAPENTLLSYEKALAHKLNAVECDVHLSRDNELVVIHDSTLDRTVNASGFVKDYDLSELRLFDVRGGGKISTLQEIFSFLHKLLRDIKSANPKLTTGVLFACEPIYPSELGKSAIADYILPEKDFCTPVMIEEAHSNNLKVFPWVVDDKSKAQLLLSYGVDGIVTNDIRKIV